MNQTEPLQRLESVAFRGSLEQLKTYAAGSNRGMLVPIDDAVRDALQNSEATRKLEGMLLEALSHCAAPEAKEYLCTKLALLGSEASVPALGRLLADSRLATASRNALERNPSPAATRVIRDAASNLSGPDLLGAIQSLGARQDDSSVSFLAKSLRHPDLAVVAAAVFALGEIGTPKAASVLKAFLPKTPPGVCAQAADAALACAERLRNSGNSKTAKSLSAEIAKGPFPDYFRTAAARD